LKEQAVAKPALDRNGLGSQCRSMPLIDHIRRCNRWTPSEFLPLMAGDKLLGLMRPETALYLSDFPELFVQHDGKVGLSDRYKTPADRTAAFRPIAERLAIEGLIDKLRDEDYRVVTKWGEKSLMQVDRAAVGLLGIKAFGIHVNGMVLKERDQDLLLWIGKRAADKAVEPGKYDNMVAGGQPAGLTLLENLEKESGEEAGLDPSLVKRAQPVSLITYCMEDGRGLKRDTLFVYDMLVPEDVEPKAVDGEMEHFVLMRRGMVLNLLRDGFSFKFNVALVLIDFLVRHGFLTPENEPDYPDLVTGLHTSLE
jgi:8-oxo-dGTP pyrophosphatase MutT (NUDIX family)